MELKNITIIPLGIENKNNRIYTKDSIDNSNFEKYIPVKIGFDGDTVGTVRRLYLEANCLKADIHIITPIVIAMLKEVLPHIAFATSGEGDILEDKKTVTLLELESINIIKKEDWSFDGLI